MPKPSQVLQMTEMSRDETSLLSQESSSYNINRCLFIRQVCLVGLYATYVLSTALLGVGIWLFTKSINHFENYKSIPEIGIPGYKIFKELIPLAINIVVTVLMECTGLIHTTTLRWSLHKEGRLTFSSNLRIFTSSRLSFPNKWPVNIMNATFIVVAYASSSLIFIQSTPEQVHQVVDPSSTFYSNDVLYVSFTAMIALAAALLGQAIFATWALRSVPVPTWSSSPIDTSRYCHYQGAERLPGQTMLSVGVPASDSPEFPLTRQISAFGAHHEIRTLVKIFWTLLSFLVTWWVVVLVVINAIIPRDSLWPCDDCNVALETGAIVYNGVGSGWWPVPDFGGTSSFLVLQLPRTMTNGEYWLFSDPLAALSLVIIAAFQSFLTLGLHSVDLLVGVSRDEDLWRTTTSKRGYDPDYNGLVAAMKNWRYVTVFLIKPFVHWQYGLSMTYFVGLGVIMRPAQIMYMSLSVMVVAIGATVVAKRGPKGPQPATFGHIQTIVNLVDDWAEHAEKPGTMYWGHKSEDEATGVCAAGTSEKQLPPIQMDKLYL